MLVKILRLNEKKGGAMPTKDAPPKVVFQQSKEYKADLRQFATRVGPKMAEFMAQKLADPMAPFGSKDLHFKSGALADTKVLHAHLTHDLQVLYRRSGRDPTVIELMRIGSHDDFGTGQPPNQKVQKTLAKQLDNMVTESKKGNVLDVLFQDLRRRHREWKTADGPPMPKSAQDLLKIIKHIKDQDIWEMTGANAPAYGPALSRRVSGSREIVLCKRSPDSKILVAQRSDTISPGEDTMSRTFANTEQGYSKALDYYVTLTR